MSAAAHKQTYERANPSAHFSTGGAGGVGGLKPLLPPDRWEMYRVRLKAAGGLLWAKLAAFPRPGFQRCPVFCRPTPQSSTAITY